LQAEIGEDRFELVRQNTMDPRGAAAQALAVYLEKVVFSVAGGHQFHFAQVLREWPESFEQLKYPSAAITSASEPRTPHALTPVALEWSWNEYAPNSVLWQTDDLAVEFQVDCWLTTKPERQAVIARLDDVFSPTETRSGLLLQAPPEYFCLPIRYSYRGGDRVDNSAAAFNRDREYRAKVLAEVPVVHLRRAVELQPLTRLEVLESA
jgi:hypothetical protein